MPADRSGQKLTVGAWFDQWLAGLRIADSTLASYKKNVRLHIKPHVGSELLTKLTSARLNALYRQLEKSGRQDHKAGGGLSARTVRYVHTIIKAALKDAVNQNLIIRNPADRAQPPSAKEAKAPEMRPWTAGQLSAFLAWSDEQGCIDAVAWRVLAFTGMRRDELLALRWRDLDADAARLSIPALDGRHQDQGAGRAAGRGAH